MSNKDFDIVAGGELQFYKAVNDYKIEKFGEPEYDENAMNIFTGKIIHSLQTLESLKPRKPSEFSKKELEKIINSRKAILSKNGFPKSYLPYFSMNDVQKTQTDLAFAELDYYRHFLNNVAAGYGFSSDLEKTEYGKLIKNGFGSGDSFIDANIKIRDAQIADKTTFIRQLAKAGKIKQSEAEKDIEKHSGLSHLIFYLKKEFVEPDESRTMRTLKFIEYLDNYVLPRY
ncbi:MAG: hypothetical protein KKB25_02210 [Nanoarchaeota archaeon]|nr:hypothetical protein [Nanoarchaeota archaeon]